jgi:hypothetical protein
MNPATGSVDTEENWLAEMKFWEENDGIDRKTQFKSLIEVIKDKEGNWIDMQAARQLMDDDMCEKIHGTVETEQEFFDAYVKAHEEKYGEEFVIN